MSRIIKHFAIALFCFFLSSLRTRSQPTSLCHEKSKNFTRTDLSNRDTVLSNLRDRSSLGSYSNTTAGLSPNTVYGMFLCIGDVNKASCSNCVQTATFRIAEDCNSDKGGFIFYDECMVRYSNFSFFNLLEDGPLFYIYSPIDSLNSSQFFNQTLRGKLDELIVRATSMLPIPYFAENQERVTLLNGSYNLETMVQCSPDIGPGNCTMCLRLAVKNFFDHNKARSAQTYFPKCLVKYNISTLQTSLGVKKGNEILGRTFIAMMAALVLALMGF